MIDYAKPLQSGPPRSRWLALLRRHSPTLLGVFVLIFVLSAGLSWLYLHPAFTRTSAVIYGTRGGRSLIMEVLTPSRPNGAGVAVLNSSGWKSGNPAGFRVWLLAPLIRRGYTVFIIGHVSQPEASVMEIFEDTERAIRYIRHQAARFGIDPRRVGVMGGSAGGHLALMLATRGSAGRADAADPVDREESSVQAAAVFFPVTDLLNLGASTANPGDGGPPLSFGPAFRASSSDLDRWRRIGTELSPLYHVTSKTPPVLIVHGDGDTLVPVDQSQRFQQKAREAGAIVRLEIHRGGTHRGWLTMVWDVRTFASWFDQHLRGE